MVFEKKKQTNEININDKQRTKNKMRNMASNKQNDKMTKWQKLKKDKKCKATNDKTHTKVWMKNLKSNKRKCWVQNRKKWQITETASKTHA